MPRPTVLLNGVRTLAGRTLAPAFREAGYYTVGLDRVDKYDYACDRFVQFDTVRYATDTDYRIRFSTILDQLLPEVAVLVHAVPVYEFSDTTGLSLSTWAAFHDGHLAGPLLLAQLVLPKLGTAGGLQLVCAPLEAPDDTNDREATPLLTAGTRLLYEAAQLQSGTAVRTVGLYPATPGKDVAQQLAATAVFLASAEGRAVRHAWWPVHPND